ncbi:hypothetical protein GIB67_016475 [Kingdonia uniflora]|uniref:Uncharacterized protein n=1 Tax=Kingdonia uniflora TaxID=39325 RepID=A0A7J7M7X4_9MAGN|nr:hypothetical protein GIB67_016475 [Kingdonia uniflora]
MESPSHYTIICEEFVDDDICTKVKKLEIVEPVADVINLSFPSQSPYESPHPCLEPCPPNTNYNVENKWVDDPSLQDIPLLLGVDSVLVTHSPTTPIPMPISLFHEPNGGTMTINDFEDLYRDNSCYIYVNECLNYFEDLNDLEIHEMVQSLASENMFQLGHVPKPMNIQVNGQDESLEITYDFRESQMTTYALNISGLEFHWSFTRSSYCIKNASSIDRIFFGYESFPTTLSRFDHYYWLGKLLKDLSNFIQALSLWGLMVITPVTLKVTYLELRTGFGKYELPGIVYLLKSCVDLEKLVIHIDRIEGTKINDFNRKCGLSYLSHYEFDKISFRSKMPRGRPVMKKPTLADDVAIISDKLDKLIEVFEMVAFYPSSPNHLHWANLKTSLLRAARSDDLNNLFASLGIKTKAFNIMENDRL